MLLVVTKNGSWHLNEGCTTTHCHIVSRNAPPWHHILSCYPCVMFQTCLTCSAVGACFGVQFHIDMKEFSCSSLAISDITHILFCQCTLVWPCQCLTYFFKFICLCCWWVVPRLLLIGVSSSKLWGVVSRLLVLNIVIWMKPLLLRSRVTTAFNLSYIKHIIVL